MVHLDAVAPAARLAEAAQPPGLAQPALLGGIEVVEAQRQHPAHVGQQADQAAPPPGLDPHIEHLPLHHGLDTGQQRGDRQHAGAILVAQWQVEQYVGDTADAECGKTRSQLRPDTAQRADRYAFEGGTRGA